MFETLNSLLTPALMQRLTLLFNHVLSSEPVATQRLLAHSGRTVSVSLRGWPALLPAPPAIAFAITPAGLLEWTGADSAAATDLRLSIDASNPARLLARALAGERPAVAIDGDSVFATDVDWVMQNVRWDIAGDLERFVGPIAAEQLRRLGGALARGIRAAVQGLDKLRPSR